MGSGGAARGARLRVPHTIAPVATPTSSQLQWRRRVEAVLRVVEPGLNLLLAAGDRLSRVADREGLDARPLPRRVDTPRQPRRVTAGPPTS